MSPDVDVLVIGAGQAGLAVSHELTASGVEHVVLERASVGSAWAGRWRSFTLVTPNHTILLPGGEYDGPDPDGFLPRDDVVAHLRRYARSFGAPVEEGRQVRALRTAQHGFRAETDTGAVLARRVVVCTGAYQAEHLPEPIPDLVPRVPVVPSASYRSPDDLPTGRVLVVGGGQSACQIADELRRADRDVVLAAGRAPAMPRRIGDRDTVDWLVDAGFFDQTLADMPSPAVRLAANPLVTGAHGGEDLNLRTLASSGVALVGRLRGLDGDRLVVADDVAESVAAGDSAFREIVDAARRVAAAAGLPVPPAPTIDDRPVRAASPPRLADLGAIVVACGYRPSYGWIDVPDLADEQGFPRQRDGMSTVVAGLAFVGVPWLRRRGSPLLLGVGDDARAVAHELAA